MAVRVLFVVDTEANFLASSQVWAAGQPLWALDKTSGKVGDGQHTFAGLPYTFGPQSFSSIPQIDDSAINFGGAGSPSSLLSSQGTITLINAALSKAQAYADSVASGVRGPRVIPVYQNSDGTWPATTAGTQDMTFWTGTVGLGTAPPADPNRDWVLLKDPT